MAEKKVNIRVAIVPNQLSNWLFFPGDSGKKSFSEIWIGSFDFRIAGHILYMSMMNTL